jgi:uncharacterized protein YndB with AHSA1/START domain
MTVTGTPISVTRTVAFDVPAATVWAAITDRDSLRTWLAPDAEIDLRPGGVGRLGLPDGERSILVTAVDPGRGVSMIWARDDDGELSSVELSVTSLDQGTLLTVVEQLILPDGPSSADPTATCIAASRAGAAAGTGAATATSAAVTMRWTWALVQLFAVCGSVCTAACTAACAA